MVGAAGRGTALEHKRAMNAGIALATVRLTPAQLCAALESLDGADDDHTGTAAAAAASPSKAGGADDNAAAAAHSPSQPQPQSSPSVLSVAQLVSVRACCLPTTDEMVSLTAVRRAADDAARGRGAGADAAAAAADGALSPVERVVFALGQV